MADDRWLVVGLGNPGPRYVGTRHNAGYLVLDLLAERASSRFSPLRATRGLADVAETRLDGVPVVLVRPHTFMNESGGAVSSVAKFFKIPTERVVVVHDELDLPYGSLRLKSGGGDGGHNGLRSTTSSLGTRDYLRVRFGIGRPPGRQDPADYVLRDFSPAERKDLGYHVDRAADSVEAVLSQGLVAAQNTYND